MKYLSLIIICISTISCNQFDFNKEYNKGLNFLENKDYENAIKVFSEIINQTDTCNDCYLNRGFAYRELNRTELARDDFNKLINSQNDLYQHLGYVNRGGTYYDMRDYNLALNDYKKGLEYDSLNAKILNMVSHMYFATNKRDSGCYYYSKSLQFGITEFNPEIPKYCDSLFSENLFEN